MSPNRATHQRPPTTNDPAVPSEQHASARSEDLHIRSYAHQAGYDLTIEVVASDGTVAFREQYSLPPGETKSEVDAVPAGEYEVRAVLGGERREVRRCRIDDSPDGTAVIEIGNGILSLTEGIRLP